MQNRFEKLLKDFEDQDEQFKDDLILHGLLEQVSRQNDPIIRALTIASNLADNMDAIPVWRDIESAPHGEWIIITGGSVRSFLFKLAIQACWNANGWWQTLSGNRVTGPTHWQPLPSPDNTLWQEIKDLLEPEILSINNGETP